MQSTYYKADVLASYFLLQSSRWRSRQSTLKAVANHRFKNNRRRFSNLRTSRLANA